MQLTDRVRKPSRLFGRELELRALEEALARVAKGAALFALVAGPSGVGKSALVLALRERAREQRSGTCKGTDRRRRAPALRSGDTGRLLQGGDRAERRGA